MYATLGDETIFLGKFEHLVDDPLIHANEIRIELMNLIYDAAVSIASDPDPEHNTEVITIEIIQ
jgi:hypothetical protein